MAVSNGNGHAARVSNDVLRDEATTSPTQYRASSR